MSTLGRAGCCPTSHPDSRRAPRVPGKRARARTRNRRNEGRDRSRQQRRRQTPSVTRVLPFLPLRAPRPCDILLELPRPKFVFAQARARVSSEFGPPCTGGGTSERSERGRPRARRDRLSMRARAPARLAWARSTETRANGFLVRGERMR